MMKIEPAAATPVIRKLTKRNLISLPSGWGEEYRRQMKESILFPDTRRA
jgi:hypothetical protein